VTGNPKTTFAPFVVGPVAFNLLPVAAEVLGLGSYDLPVYLFAPLGAVCAVLAAYPAWRGRNRLAWKKLALLGATVALTAYPCRRLCNPARQWAFSALAERSRPIVSAIQAYAREHGHPPQSLNDLVPRQLDRIPSTRMPAYPAYEYSVPKADSPVMLRWYDLGSRNGAPFPGLWRYPDGDAGHAILVLTTSRDNIVREVQVDRNVPSAAARPFDAVAWRQEPSVRMQMLANVRGKIAVGQHLRDVLEILGPEDGQRVLSDTPWELRVPCSRGILNWDLFFYWPGQRYPSVGYGGSIERIADWAYVHE
jgi:hypothetical protein